MAEAAPSDFPTCWLCRHVRAAYDQKPADKKCLQSFCEIVNRVNGCLKEANLWMFYAAALYHA